MAYGFPEQRGHAGRHGVVGTAAGLIIGLLAVGTLAVGGARAEPSGGDIQWAQTILNDKGFKVGKPNGQLTPVTRQALSAYQKSVGLKPTGDLDAATVARMMEGRPTSNTTRTLGAPDPSRPRAGGGPEPKPQASPVMSVQSSGGDGDTIVGTVRRAGGEQQHPAPSAAPRLGVTAEATPTPAGQPEPPEVDAPFRLTAPSWVRMGIIGLIPAIFGFAGWWWWSSGRRPAPVARPTAPRQEPTLTSPAAGRVASRRAPVLSARGGGGRRG